MPTPSYYLGKSGKLQPVDIIEDFDLSYHRGTALVYIVRAGRKPGESEAKDLKKARDHLDMAITAAERREPIVMSGDFVETQMAQRAPAPEEQPPFLSISRREHSRRTRMGLERARREGKQIGRKGLSEEDQARLRAELGVQVSVRQAALVAGVRYATAKKYAQAWGMADRRRSKAEKANVAPTTAPASPEPPELLPGAYFCSSCARVAASALRLQHTCPNRSVLCAPKRATEVVIA